MNIPELVISGPDSIASSIPYVIGFTPANSLVVMWLRDGCVRLTMRLDLPPSQAAPDDWVDAVMPYRSSSDEVIVCIVLSARDSARDIGGELHSQGLMSMLLARLAETDCRVRDALLVSADRWWSYLCDEPECCPLAGTPIDPEIAKEVAARFALAGVARLPDREAVIALCAADPARQLAVRHDLREARRARSERLAAGGDGPGEFEAWRDESISAVGRWLMGEVEVGSLAPAQILLALSDVRVRDTVLWDLANSQEHDAHRAFDRAAAVLRAAPSGAVAPIGSVTALLGWLIGDGVRAVAALDRVTEDDPAYTLAELLGRSIGAGLSPVSWLEMMRDLGRDACRGGRPAQQAIAAP